MILGWAIVAVAAAVFVTALVVVIRDVSKLARGTAPFRVRTGVLSFAVILLTVLCTVGVITLTR